MDRLDGPAAKAPRGQRIYAIGDVHGRSDLLRELHEIIVRDSAGAPSDRTIVYLGDYVDRGPDSRGVLDILIGEALPGFRSIHLVGNHEAVLLQFLQDAEIARDWLNFGGEATLASYGVRLDPRRYAVTDLLRAKEELTRALPPEHLAFLRRLKLNHWAGDYFFVHAGVRPGVPLDRQTGNDQIWIRDLFLDSDASFGRIVVHGHTPNVAVQSRRNRIGIDTGAYFTGRLTAVVLEGETRRFLST
ncbi:MAG: metallophosphoesterase family protein [Pseudomonadota bacterium]|nr:metallophosphoesterase family protein [Pseudomonadota bacterium]